MTVEHYTTTLLYRCLLAVVVLYSCTYCRVGSMRATAVSRFSDERTRATADPIVTAAETLL